MGANCLIFDDCLISGAPIERTKRGLNACASDASEYLRSLRSVAAQLIRPALMKHSARESAETEDPLIAQLVASSKDGDSAAMELLIERYQSRVAGFVFACVGDGQAVEDLCQTIFYKMLVGLRRLEEDGKFEPWLFRIARNTCFDYFRRRRLRRIFVPWQSAADQASSAAEPRGKFYRRSHRQLQARAHEAAEGTARVGRAAAGPEVELRTIGGDYR